MTAAIQNFISDFPAAIHSAQIREKKLEHCLAERIERLDLESAIRETGDPHTFKKVARVAGFIIFYIFATLFTFGYFIYLRNRVLSKTEKTKEELGSSRFQALQNGIGAEFYGRTGTKKGYEWSKDALRQECLLCDPNLNPLALENFLLHIQNIQKLMQTPPPCKNLSFHAQEVRREIEKAITSEIYQKLQEFRRNPCVDLIETLSSKFRTAAHGSHSILSFAKEQIGPIASSPEYNCGDLANAISVGLRRSAFLKRDQLSWTLAFPDKVVQAIKGQNEPLQYNPYEAGNVDMVAWDYFLMDGEKRKSLRFYLGPTPTGDHLIDSHLSRLQKQGLIELRHNLQSLTSLGEDARTFALMKKEEENPDSCRLFSTPCDGKAWDMKDEFQGAPNPKDFFLLYAKYAIADDLSNPSTSIEEIQGNAFRFCRKDWKKDNGFYIGKKVMSDHQFKQAFASSRNACQEIYETAEGKSFWDKMEPNKTRQGRMLQLACQGFLSIGAILQTLRDIPADVENGLNQKLDDDLQMATFGQACKLDIDRGVVLNVLTRIYYQLISNQPLKEEDLYSIAGTVLFRAALVDSKCIEPSRVRPLIDLLRFIGNNQGRLQRHLQSYASLF